MTKINCITILLLASLQVNASCVDDWLKNNWTHATELDSDQRATEIVAACQLHQLKSEKPYDTVFRIVNAEINSSRRPISHREAQ